MNYKAPLWLPGGHAQTLWPSMVANAITPTPFYQRERWATPDGDFIDLDWQPPANATDRQRPLLVLFHGLEGNSQSHHARAFADYAARNGMAFVVPQFRGCSGEMNLAPRAYHSGDYEVIDWILQRLCQVQSGPLLVAGVSLGGNALLRWAAEAGASYNQRVRAVAGICAPVDLQAAGQALGRGLNRLVYTPIFLRTMKPKALRKLAQFPGLFDARRMLAARTLYEFDNVVTAPLHGFADTDDYWRRASAKPHLGHIRVPALVLNALNDPFIPAGSLPDPALREASPSLTWWRPAQGGHIGFVRGLPPGDASTMPTAVGDWLAGHLK